ncbi:MAG: hypothetical protein HY909_31080 [Deltaproteobacteria bacterium]|nr:hypothetical protein [Deltaproteobacteria bacterium]
MHHRATFLLGAVALLGEGCSMFLHAQGGAVIGTSGAVGGALEASGGFGSGSTGQGSQSGYGYEATLRMKVSPDLVSAAIGSGGYLASMGSDYFVWAHAGMHLVQLDVLDRRAQVSAFSPYTSFGYGFRLSDGARLTVGLSMEYDLRFEAPDEGFFGLQLGYAGFGAQGR